VSRLGWFVVIGATWVAGIVFLLALLKGAGNLRKRGDRS
jgi:hypothetical protein